MVVMLDKSSHMSPSFTDVLLLVWGIDPPKKARRPCIFTSDSRQLEQMIRDEIPKPQDFNNVSREKEVQVCLFI